MTRMRALTLVLGVAVLAVLAVGGSVATQRVDAQVQAPTNDSSGLIVTFWVHCGSVVSPTGDVPDDAWVYSGRSCAQKLAVLRRAAWTWPADIAAVFGLIALGVATIKRPSGRRPSDSAPPPPACRAPSRR